MNPLKDALAALFRRSEKKPANEPGAGAPAGVDEPANRRLAYAQSIAAFVKQMGASPDPSLREMQGFADFCLGNYALAQGQLFQDLFVLFTLRSKRGGFFVEFGATNGIELSNTYVLEKHFGWTGVLAEPARCWHGVLAANRHCPIDHRCVWSSSGAQLEFNEATAPEFSTINAFSEFDDHSSLRSEGTRYAVQTISLNDLLAEHGAPKVVDYLSIDTEGSELDILRNFDFGSREFRVITVEHNQIEPRRSEIFNLLSAHGYERRLAALSQFDDWYVKT
jgi:FkbM family methyltransferase